MIHIKLKHLLQYLKVGKKTKKTAAYVFTSTTMKGFSKVTKQ